MNRFHRYYCASRGWARLVQTTLVPAVLEETELGRRVLEIGPGPGLTTEVLAGVATELTAVEIDPTLARATRHRVPAAHVVQGDATRMPFADATFSAVVCLTMLHHLPTPELQDRLFAEVHRVLAPGGVFCGSDNPGRGLKFRLIHIGDNRTIVDPATLGTRLQRAGLEQARVRTGSRIVFHAHRPHEGLDLAGGSGRAAAAHRPMTGQGGPAAWVLVEGGGASVSRCACWMSWPSRSTARW